MTRVWTQETKLAALMRLPWTIVVDQDEDGSLVAHVEEVPDAIGDGRDERELARDLWESLAASLDARLAHGDEIPFPVGSQLPWLADPEPPAERVIRAQKVVDGAAALRDALDISFTANPVAA